MPTVELNYTYTKAQAEIFFPANPAKYTIVSKGRRLGATRGAAQACIEDLLDKKGPWLWVDTVNPNIDRYFERYFVPALKGIDYNWNKQKRELNIYGQWCDFRSADRPENIEGFGYRKIFLNEAGIILEDDYLYDNALSSYSSCRKILNIYPYRCRIVGYGSQSKVTRAVGDLFRSLADRA